MVTVYRGGISPHSTTPTPTPTSSRGSSRECRRVVQLATGITSIARVGRVGEDTREKGRCRCRRRGMRALADTDENTKYRTPA